jgi:hypothetical protein
VSDTTNKENEHFHCPKKFLPSKSSAVSFLLHSSVSSPVFLHTAIMISVAYWLALLFLEFRVDETIQLALLFHLTSFTRHSIFVGQVLVTHACNPSYLGG